MDETIDTLARTAWAEARSHGLDGMAAVLNTVANRAGTPGWWGRTLAGVCKAPRQFSCWNPDIAAKNRILTVDLADPDFYDAVMLAKALVRGELRDRTHGADHYHADYIPTPKWAKGRRPVYECGPSGSRHLFYRIGLTA